MIGMILMVVVQTANIQDQGGAKVVLEKIKGRFSWLQLRWADGSYTGKLIEWVKTTISCVFQIVKCSDTITGFNVHPKRSWKELSAGK